VVYVDINNNNNNNIHYKLLWLNYQTYKLMSVQFIRMRFSMAGKN